MQTRLAAELPGVDTNEHRDTVAQLPAFIREGFADAMGQSLFLPAAALLVGVAATVFLVRPKHQTSATDDVAAFAEGEVEGAGASG